MGREYVDFDVEIERVATGYVTSVRDSGPQPALAPFVLPFEAAELAQFMVAVGPPRVSSRRLVPAQARVADVKDYGRRLGDALLAGPVGDAFRGRLDTARAAHRDVRIRLRLTSVPELEPVPWEYLYSTSLGRFVTLSAQTPVVRLFDALDVPPAVTVAAPLRVLVMISSPSDIPALAVEREEQLLQATTGDLVKSGQLELVVLEDATLGTLQRTLLDPFHVFHFIGHGGFDREAQEGVLVLEREDGTAHRVSGARLGTLLHDARDMQLAVLNACEGARTSGRDAFSGVGQALVRQGLPAVVAMQTEISDRAALVFSHEFYWFITRGLPIEAAICEVRKAMAVSDEASEWGTAVLLRSDAAQPFTFVPSTITVPDRSSRWASLYEAAQGALAADASDTARPILEQLAAESPDYADVTQLLERVNPESAPAAATTSSASHVPKTDTPSASTVSDEATERAGALETAEAQGAAAAQDSAGDLIDPRIGAGRAEGTSAGKQGGRRPGRTAYRRGTVLLAGGAVLLAAAIGVGVWRTLSAPSPLSAPPSGSARTDTTAPTPGSVRTATLPTSGEPIGQAVLPYAFAGDLHAASGTRPLGVNGDVTDVVRLRGNTAVVTATRPDGEEMRLKSRTGSTLADLGDVPSHVEASKGGARFAYVDEGGSIVVREATGQEVTRLPDAGTDARVAGFADDAVFFSRGGSTWRWDTTTDEVVRWRNQAMVVFNDTMKTAVGSSGQGCFAVVRVDQPTQQDVSLHCQGAEVLGITGDATHAIALRHGSGGDPDRVLLLSLATGAADLQIEVPQGQVVNSVGYRTSPAPRTVVLDVGTGEGDRLYACPVDGPCSILTPTQPAPASGLPAYVISRD